MKIVKSIAICTIFILSACHVKEIKVDSSVELPTEFRYMSKYLNDNNQLGLEQWWQLWQDPTLDDLIKKGIQKNYDLAIAKEQITEARAIRKLAGADLFPQIGFTADWAKAKNAEWKHNINLPLLPTSFTNDITTSYYAPVVKWEPDIFKKSNTRDAAAYALLAEKDRANGVRVLVTGEIAEQYFTAVAIYNQQLLLNKSIKILSELERYVLGRYQAGQTDISAVHEIRMNLNELRAKKPALQAQFNLIEQSIAVLVGEVPQIFKLQITKNILSVEPALPNAIAPSDILLRRPDIRARANAVKAYVAKTKAARADLLPKFSLNFALLNGRIELGSFPASNLFSPLASVGVNLPIFTFGRIKANIEATDSKLKQTLLAYDKSLLEALKEIDGAYQMSTLLQQSLTSLDKATKNAKAYTNSRYRFFNTGSITYKDALESELKYLSLNDKLIQMQLNTAKAKIKLYQALGGGWDFIQPIKTTTSKK